MILSASVIGLFMLEKESNVSRTDLPLYQLLVVLTTLPPSIAEVGMKIRRSSITTSLKSPLANSLMKATLSLKTSSDH